MASCVRPLPLTTRSPQVRRRKSCGTSGTSCPPLASPTFPTSLSCWTSRVCWPRLAGRCRFLRAVHPGLRGRKPASRRSGRRGRWTAARVSRAARRTDGSHRTRSDSWGSIRWPQARRKPRNAGALLAAQRRLPRWQQTALSTSLLEISVTCKSSACSTRPAKSRRKRGGAGRRGRQRRAASGARRRHERVRRGRLEGVARDPRSRTQRRCERRKA